MNIDSYIPGNMDWAFLPANRKSADYEALLMTRDGDISCLAAPRPTWVLLFYLEIKVKRSGVVWKR